MHSFRTFIAFEVGNDVKARAADLIKRLKKAEAEVNWVPPQNMHITLKFLGDVPNVEIPDLCRHVAEAVADFKPFDIEFLSAGAFPQNDRPRTLWLGVAEDEGYEQLAALNEAIEERLHSQMGFARERRRFQPHLTIGRVNSTGAAQQALGEIVEQHVNFDGALSEVDEVLIFASYLEKSGPTYNVLGRAGLA